MPTTTTTTTTGAAGTTTVTETVALLADAAATAADAAAAAAAAAAVEPPTTSTTPVWFQRDNSWAPVGGAATPVDPVGPEGYGRVGLLTKRPAPELDDSCITFEDR